jgi:hypothetical protein
MSERCSGVWECYGDSECEGFTKAVPCGGCVNNQCANDCFNSGTSCYSSWDCYKCEAAETCEGGQYGKCGPVPDFCGKDEDCPPDMYCLLQ